VAWLEWRYRLVYGGYLDGRRITPAGEGSLVAEYLWRIDIGA